MGALLIKSHAFIIKRKRDYMIYAAAAAAVICAALFCFYQNNKLDITNYEIASKDCKKGFRIVQLSDFHSKPAESVLKKTDRLKPNIICITGDYINDKCRRKNKMLEYGKRLCEIAPVYYIIGNHERRLDCFDGLMEELRQIGFTVLLNECVRTEYGAVLGLDENQADFKDYIARKNGTFVYRDMKPYFDKIERESGFRLVLSHFPENFEGVRELNYSQYDFDLQLSGHAHGGQWIIFKPLFSPGQGVLPKYARGSFGTRPRLIISRGLGNSEFPLRLFNHPEIVVIDVKPDKKKGINP